MDIKRSITIYYITKSEFIKINTLLGRGNTLMWLRKPNIFKKVMNESTNGNHFTVQNFTKFTVHELMPSWRIKFPMKQYIIMYL